MDFSQSWVIVQRGNPQLFMRSNVTSRSKVIWGRVKRWLKIWKCSHLKSNWNQTWLIDIKWVPLFMQAKVIYQGQKSSDSLHMDRGQGCAWIAYLRLTAFRICIFNVKMNRFEAHLMVFIKSRFQSTPVSQSRLIYPRAKFKRVLHPDQFRDCAFFSKITRNLRQVKYASYRQPS